MQSIQERVCAAWSYAAGAAAPTHTTWKRGQPTELDPAVVPSSERGEVVHEHAEVGISQFKAAAAPPDKQVHADHISFHFGISNSPTERSVQPPLMCR